MADPILTNVVMCSNFIQEVSSTFYRSEIDNQLWQMVNNAELTTAQTKFSNTTLHTDGDTDRATYGSASEFAFISNKTTDWTLEFWIYIPDVAASDKIILSTRSANLGGFSITVYDTGSLVFYDATTGLYYFETAASTITSATWHYIKFTSVVLAYPDGYASMYLNGSLVGTKTLVGATPISPYNGNLLLMLGGGQTSTIRDANAYYGPMRITAGQALNDTDVPTAIFNTTAQYTGMISSPGASGTPTIFGVNDFTGGLTGNEPTAWVMDLTTSSGVVRVPISSYNGTLKTGTSNYVQVVVPAAAAWESTIAAATQMDISRVVEIGGAPFTYLMATAPVQTKRSDLSPTTLTYTLSGYAPGNPVDPNPPAASNRTLTGVRSITTGSGIRARADIDFILRPGDRAFANGVEIIVSYINYYVNNSDAYMDCGQSS